MEGENGGAERGDDSSAAAGDGEGGRSASSDAEEGNWSSTSLLYSQSCEAIELEGWDCSSPFHWMHSNCFRETKQELNLLHSPKIHLIQNFWNKVVATLTGKGIQVARLSLFHQGKAWRDLIGS
ncbi:uncharacterized protein LOC120268948 isoform X1 [Dioscorea cayenensis subsp. rotundata]|uniref:Uncharacterized protein LOC120268948 isoform X1 n=1 Tax=Dioscorea cayennensis subsp. rotundata TaxID=55577 RepID=A0AB40BXG9_DIOCR|nr:uncharacterized protein LOC120268948 isoform X1 [Dioscorea cayenensis subsp. rotundata]